MRVAARLTVARTLVLGHRHRLKAPLQAQKTKYVTKLLKGPGMIYGPSTTLLVRHHHFIRDFQMSLTILSVAALVWVLSLVTASS